MTVARTENSNLAKEVDDEDLLAGIEPAELLATAREKVTALVKAHPAATLLGAFAIGFAVARLVRALGED
jgi:hypothetical protein